MWQRSSSTARMSSLSACTSAPHGSLMRSTSDPDTEPTMPLSRLYRTLLELLSQKCGSPRVNVWIMSILIWSSVNQVVVLRDPSILDGLDLTEEERGVLIDNINRRLTPQAVKIRAGIRSLALFFDFFSGWNRMIWQLDFLSLCRHRGGVLRVWRHWCSERCTESWTRLLHRSHAHQSIPGLQPCFYSASQCCRLDLSTDIRVTMS